jgi:hypothetical protein
MDPYDSVGQIIYWFKILAEENNLNLQ